MTVFCNGTYAANMCMHLPLAASWAHQNAPNSFCAVALARWGTRDAPQTPNGMGRGYLLSSAPSASGSRRFGVSFVDNLFVSARMTETLCTSRRPASALGIRQ